MPDPKVRGTEEPHLLHKMREFNDTVEPPSIDGPGATAIDRRIVAAAPAGITGRELLASSGDSTWHSVPIPRVSHRGRTVGSLRHCPGSSSSCSVWWA